MFVSIGQAAEIIGVSISTLRRWETEGRFIAHHRTCGKHRRYSLSEIKEIFLGEKQSTTLRKTICYARVSSHDQKKDLETPVFTSKVYGKRSHSNKRLAA